MSDSTLNYFLARGTTAQRLAFGPSPPSPANAPPTQGYLFWDEDLQQLFAYDFNLAAWVATGSGSGGAAISAGTQSGNTGTIVFSASNGITFGMSNSSIVTATVKTNYAGTGLTTATTTGTVIVGTNSTNGLSLGVPAWITAGGGGGSVNVSAGTTSNNLTALTFANSNGISFGLNASTITATVKTDYQSSGNYLTTAALSGDTSKYAQAWDLTGNTSGTTSSLQGTVWHFQGGNNITVSGSSNTIVFSGANAAGAQTAISGIVASNTTYTSGTVTFSGVGGGVTVNSNTGQRIDISVGNYITTADLSQNSSKYVQNWKLTGNTAGTTSSAQGTDLWFSGGNSITVSGSSNSIVFSVGNYLTTAMQSNAATISNINVSGGTTSSNLSNFKLIDSNGVSWSLDTGSKIYATVKTDYLTTADLSANSSKYVQNWKLTGNTAGTTSSAAGTDLWFSGGNSITVSGSSNSIVFSVGNYITTAALSGDTTKYAQAWDLTGNTSGTTSSLQGSLWHFSGGANLTISGSSNTLVFSAGSAAAAPVNFSAGTTSGNLGSVVFSNSNGISFGLNGSTITGTVSTYSTVGTATTGYDVASANSIGSITRWAAEDHRHAGIGAIGISTGNTSGTSGSNQGTYWFVGGTNQTVSQITSNNGSHTLVIAGKNEGYAPILEPYPLNTATQTFAPGAGTWYLAPFTAFGSMSGGRINVLVNNTGTANLFLDIGETAYNSGSTGGIQQSYTLSAAVALFSQGTGSNSSRLESLWSNSYSMGWSKSQSISTNAATNIAVSMAHSVSYIQDIGSDGAYTLSQYAGAGSSTFGNSSGASTGVSTVFSSGRNLVSGSVVQPFGFNTTISAGNYWLGYAWSSTRARASTGNLTTGSDFSFGGLLGLSRLAVDSLYRNFGSTVTTARSQQVPYGLYTAAANMTPPVFVNFSSDLSSLASQWVPYFNFQVRGLTR